MSFLANSQGRPTPVRGRLKSARAGRLPASHITAWLQPRPTPAPTRRHRVPPVRRQAGAAASCPGRLSSFLPSCLLPLLPASVWNAKNAVLGHTSLGWPCHAWAGQPQAEEPAFPDGVIFLKLEATQDMESLSRKR